MRFGYHNLNLILCILLVAAMLSGGSCSPTEDLGRYWIKLKVQGAIVDLLVNPEKILEKEFSASSIERRGDNYIVTIKGNVSDDLPDKIGYPGSKIVYKGGDSRITIQSSPDEVVMNYLGRSLDAGVKICEIDPVRYEIRKNVTRDSLNAILAPVGGSVTAGEDSFVDGVTEETMWETKRVLDLKLYWLGLQNVKVRIVDNKFILIDLAGVDAAAVQDAISKPGKFEMRIRTENNQSMHVLYGDAVDSVEIPRGDGNGSWGVPFTLSEEGAQIFQKMAIDAGATKNPDAHNIAMYLDKDVIFDAPLSPELAASIEKFPMRHFLVQTGSGDEGSFKAKSLYIDLLAGALPVNVEIVGSGKAASPGIGDIMYNGLGKLLEQLLAKYFASEINESPENLTRSAENIWKNMKAEQ